LGCGTGRCRLLAGLGRVARAARLVGRRGGVLLALHAAGLAATQALGLGVERHRRQPEGDDDG
jgi:hypothetical protein